jgi:hypothetical protein
MFIESKAASVFFPLTFQSLMFSARISDLLTFQFPPTFTSLFRFLVITIIYLTHLHPLFVFMSSLSFHLTPLHPPSYTSPHYHFISPHSPSSAGEHVCDRLCDAGSPIKRVKVRSQRPGTLSQYAPQNYTAAALRISLPKFFNIYFSIPAVNFRQVNFSVYSKLMSCLIEISLR